MFLEKSKKTSEVFGLPDPDLAPDLSVNTQKIQGKNLISTVL